MKLTALVITKLMTAAVAAEAPWLTDESSLRGTEYRAGIAELAGIVELVAKQDRLGEGPDVEAALLSGMLLFESRFQPYPKDGDCQQWHRLIDTPRGTWPKRYIPVMALRCSAIGPAQIGRGLPAWIRWMPDVTAWWASEPPLTIKRLRVPAINVTYQRDLLAHWKGTCGTAIPGYWMTAWGWGDCPHKKSPRVRPGYVDDEGRRRCAVARAMLDWADATSDGWVCGHEKRKVDAFGQRFAKAISATKSTSTATVAMR